MRTLGLLVAAACVVLASGCYCSHLPSRFTYGDTDGGRDGASPVDGSAPADGRVDAGCTAMLGTLQNCTRCGETCGWVCSASGCNDPVHLAQSALHACAVRQDGAVYCWGYNPGGFLGDGSSADRFAPTEVADLRNATAVAVGSAVSRHHSCAILADRTLRCWGDNLLGQVGDGTTIDRTSPVPVVGLSNVTAVSAGGTDTCAIANSEVWCWGARYDSTPSRIGGLASVAEIAVGEGHACALLSSGRIFCWGRNDMGQLGNGTTTDSAAPVEAMGFADAEHITAAGMRSCALMSTGGVRCWGQDYGSSASAIAGIGVALEIASGLTHTCALVSDRTVRCWGSNGFGELGDGTTNPSATPVTVVGLRGVDHVFAGGGSSCALAAGAPSCWGSGPLGDGTMTPSRTPIRVLAPP